MNESKGNDRNNVGIANGAFGNVLSPSSIEEMISVVKSAKRIHVGGARTKTGLWNLQEADQSDFPLTQLSTSSLRGIVTYDPQEFVVTVYAGTPVTEVCEMLAKENQYLPFDPLLTQRGATIGGTVASNASGPGRFRFGGIRDFLLGVRFLDGYGNDIRGGGQVVKNAAGFDYPKLMVGSCGKLGVVYELTFKVFPRPESFTSIITTFENLPDALSAVNQIATSPMDVEALDVVPVSSATNSFALAIRIGGLRDAMDARIDRIRSTWTESEVLRDEEDELYWSKVTNFSWAPAEWSVLKVPTSPADITWLDQSLPNSSLRRYSVGGNVAWIASERFSESPASSWPVQCFLAGSQTGTTNIAPVGAFGRALKRAIDPTNKFV